MGTGMVAQKVRARSDHRDQRHDQFLTDRVDGRVGDLREVLLEIVVEQLGAFRQNRNRRVCTHGPDGVFGGGRHGGEEELQVLLRIAKGLLTIEQGLGVALAIGLFERHGQLFQLELGFAEPFVIGLGFGEGALDLAILDDLAQFQVDQQHLAGLEAPFAGDALFRDRQDARF